MNRDIDVNQVANNMQYITLIDMAVSVDIDKVLTEEYDEGPRDFCLYFVQRFYNQIVKERKGTLNRAGLEKALTLAKFSATKVLMVHMGELVDKTKLFMLADAQDTQWFHDMEYDDVAELLSGFLEGKEGMDEAYDWKFIVEKLIPAARKIKVEPGHIVEATLGIKKLRGMVPAARELLRQQEDGEIGEQETHNILTNWLLMAASQDVSYVGMREELDKWRGLIVARDEPRKGYKILMPNGKFMMVIETETDKDISMIEQALRNRVDFSITGFDWLIAKVVGESKASRQDELMARIQRNLSGV